MSEYSDELFDGDSDSPEYPLQTSCSEDSNSESDVEQQKARELEKQTNLMKEFFAPKTQQKNDKTRHPLQNRTPSQEKLPTSPWSMPVYRSNKKHGHGSRTNVSTPKTQALMKPRSAEPSKKKKHISDI